jgi:hypothetical protein
LAVILRDYDDAFCVELVGVDRQGRQGVRRRDHQGDLHRVRHQGAHRHQVPIHVGLHRVLDDVRPEEGYYGVPEGHP